MTRKDCLLEQDYAAAVSTPPFHQRYRLTVDIIAYIVCVGTLVLVLIHNASALGYTWQWHRIPRYLPSLLSGLGVTIRISLVSLFLSLAIALVTAVLRLSSSFTGHAIARIYLEATRNTPLIVQLFFIYFVIAPVIGIDGWTSAIIALSMFEGSYASEIIRGGIVSLPKGQWEACYSLGLNRRDALRYVILPQAVRKILPPLAGQAVSLIKDSALVSTIAVYDLTMRGQTIVAQTFLTFEIWFTVAAMYLVITVSLSVAIKVLEKRLASEEL